MKMEVQILHNGTAEEMFSKFMDPDLLTEKWSFSSPVPVVTIIAVYLLVVLKLGPMFMKNRKGYNLEIVMRLYNVVQVLYNGFLMMLYFKTTSGRIPIYYISSISCNLPTDDFGGSIHLKNLFVFVGWNYVFIKMIDLLDTVFMVLRKKSTQVTFLHVYHHAATVFFSWYSYRHIKAPQGAVLLLPNIFVHVAMYLYYFLATFDSLKKYLWWKKTLTKLQLVQFAIILSYICLLYYKRCLISPSFTIIWIFNVVVVMSLFINFYVKEYVMGSNKVQNKSMKSKIT